MTPRSRTCTILPLICILAGSASAQQQPNTLIAGSTINGPARAIDGDTLAVSGLQIRLYGIDAPETRQTCMLHDKPWPCGRAATRELRILLAGKPVSCSAKDRDRYGRIVAVCHLGSIDINSWMVRNGWALAYRKYSRAYVDEQASARERRLGIWRSTFTAPWDWRSRKNRKPTTTTRLPAPNTSRSSGPCLIKGNIGSSGRIYHLPGGAYYDRTRISESRGEKWFCTEAEARAAGWRRSGR